MKICPKCQAEFSDDISVCSCCGTPLQLKPQESICPGCGEAIHANNTVNNAVIPPGNSNNKRSDFLFSLKGRRGRVKYFLMSVFIVLVYLALQLWVISIFKTVNTVSGAVSFVLYITALYLLICNEAKRFHDLNRANIWAVIFMIVPILICALSPLYGFIVMAIMHIYPLFFKGTKGPNRFGDEP